MRAGNDYAGVRRVKACRNGGRCRSIGTKFTSGPRIVRATLLRVRAVASRLFGLRDA